MARFNVVEDGADTASIVEAESNDVVVYQGRALRELPVEQAALMIEALEKADAADWSTNLADADNVDAV